MIICTSIGPRRTERQQQCINSWLNLGYKVIAVQTVGETATLQQKYPGVVFAETNQIGDMFRRPNLVRIRAILDQARISPILILNSDIEIRSTTAEFDRLWETPNGKVLKMGIRWDEFPDGTRKLLKYGIDAFLITPKIAKDLNDIGMTMGCPAWDYWIPIHLQRKGYEMLTSKSESLVHTVHPQNWNKQDFNTGVQLLQMVYDVTLREASSFILKITERTNL
jgi:hypothetical protein